MSPSTLPDPAEPHAEDPGFRDFDPIGVIEQPFWERYNTQLEAPVSAALVVLLMAAGVALYLGLQMFDKPGKTSPPIRFLGGDDDEGDGSPGGGTPELAQGKQAATPDASQVVSPAQLNDVKKEIRERLDVTGEIDIPDGQAAALAQLSKDLRDKLNGAKPGAGSGAKGGDTNGTGPGGFGASSTYARGLRWIMKFETSNGQDYINQIAGIGGVILVPMPPDNRKMVLFKNLRAPQGVPATDADIDTYAKLIQFGENGRETVAAVAEVLKVGFKPTVFFVYFPSELEEKLASLERNYNNKPVEQIRSTTFKVVQKGGGYDFIVTDQKLR